MGRPREPHAVTHCGSAVRNTPSTLRWMMPPWASTCCCVAIVASIVSAGPVSLTLNGAPAVLGTYAFPAQAKDVVFDNGLVRFTFGPNYTPLYDYTTLTASDVIVNGVSLAKNITGEQGDPSATQSFYIDSGGGKGTFLRCDTIKVLRLSVDLVELAVIDSKSTPLQHEHHLLMTSTTRGLYGYNILHATSPTSISEVRMNTRWDRCILNNSFNFERGHDLRQPSYAYLFTQQQLQDETWLLDGAPNASLPCPSDNNAGLPRGFVYSKYTWSLYHHENPFWGHFGFMDGASYGAFFTPLGGVTDGTSSASYGVGPTHQDLALHQDAIILNYMGPNHYGLPGYPLPRGYRRLYGPWLTFVSTVPGSDAAALIADATATAWGAINASLGGLAIINDTLYPPPSSRFVVTGSIRITDGRPVDALWILLCTQVGDVVYTLHENTYFVRTGPSGAFVLPGIPPATYALYVFSRGGSITGQLRVEGVAVDDGAAVNGTVDLGVIEWSPIQYGAYLWQIGVADRMGGEFALGDAHRDWSLTGRVPGNLTFTIGASHEPTDWYFAQTQAGVWAVVFTLPSPPPPGTAVLTVSASLTDGNTPVLTVNGVSDGRINGSLPFGTDSTLNRQAVRSGYARLAEVTFPSSLLHKGVNNLTFSRSNVGTYNNTGMGYDCIVLEIDTRAAATADDFAAPTGRDDDGGEATANFNLRSSGGDVDDGTTTLYNRRGAVLSVDVVLAGVVESAPGTGALSLRWRLRVSNTGTAHAMHVLLSAFEVTCTGPAYATADADSAGYSRAIADAVAENAHVTNTDAVHQVTVTSDSLSTDAHGRSLSRSPLPLGNIVTGGSTSDIDMYSKGGECGELESPRGGGRAFRVGVGVTANGGSATVQLVRHFVR